MQSGDVLPGLFGWADAEDDAFGEDDAFAEDDAFGEGDAFGSEEEAGSANKETSYWLTINVFQIFN